MDEKRNRIRLSLPTEGWLYLVILAFVSVCAVLRNVNLLIIISGVMFAPLFLSWRISRHMVRNATAKRILPHRIHVGQMITVQWKVTNLSQIPFWYIKITDQIQPIAPSFIPEPVDQGAKRIRQMSQRQQEPSLVSVVLVHVATGSTEYTAYRCLFASRGAYEAGPAVVSTQFPLGLIRSWFCIRRKDTWYVAPRLGTLHPDWDRRLGSLAHGNESARRRRGTDQEEFYALRRWRSGDNMRQIHWRTSAKYRRPMVRQFEQKSNRDIAIVLDLYVDRDPNVLLENAPDQCELILSFAATLLTQIGNAVKGRIGFAVAGQETCVFTNRSQVSFTSNVMRHLATASGGAQPDLQLAIADVLACVAPGTPCFVVSTRNLNGDQIAQLLDPSTWRKTQNAIRWLACDSSEFEKLFSVDDSLADRHLAQLKNDEMTPSTSPVTPIASAEARHVPT
jgi:uncharacterized protein (DUF58 family)